MRRRLSPNAEMTSEAVERRQEDRGRRPTKLQRERLGERALLPWVSRERRYSDMGERWILHVRHPHVQIGELCLELVHHQWGLLG
jgi:hypothetical protein